MSTAMMHFDSARLQIEKAASIDEVKEIRDKAEALRAYIKQSGGSLEMQNNCAIIRLRAERKAGEMLAEMEKQGPGEYQRSHDVTVAPKLSDLGISKMQSHRWQAISSIPEDRFDSYVADTVAAKHEITTSGALSIAKSLKKASIVSECGMPTPKPMRPMKDSRNSRRI